MKHFFVLAFMILSSSPAFAEQDEAAALLFINGDYLCENRVEGSFDIKVDRSPTGAYLAVSGDVLGIGSNFVLGAMHGHKREGDRLDSRTYWDLSAGRNIDFKLEIESPSRFDLIIEHAHDPDMGFQCELISAEPLSESTVSAGLAELRALLKEASSLIEALSPKDD